MRVGSSRLADWLPLSLLVAALVAIGCAPAKRTPTPTTTPFPTLLLVQTATPSDTPPPSDTPTATGAVSGATPAANTQYKYPAPVAVGPQQPTTYKTGNDITFTYTSVGPIPSNVCYLVHVDMINPNVATKNNRGDDFLDKDDCGDQSRIGNLLTFILFRGNFRNSPNYGTIESAALALAPLADNQMLGMTWYVRVVRNNGLSADGVHYKVVPLSPPSAVLTLSFKP